MMALPRARGKICRLILPGTLALMVAVASLSDSGLQTASAYVANQSAKEPRIDWGAKVTSIKQLLKEKTPVLYPDYIPQGFQQTAIKKVWVLKTEWSPLPSQDREISNRPSGNKHPSSSREKPRVRRVPARKVVFISFTKAEDSTVGIFLFQTPSLKGVHTLDNIYPAFGDGYFITEIQLHDIMRQRRIGNQDCLMVFRGVAEGEITRIVKSLKRWDKPDAKK
jgi:hypothetical protein